MYLLPTASIICVTNNHKILVTYKNQHLLLICLQVGWAQQGSSTDIGLAFSHTGVGWELADGGWNWLVQLSSVSCISSLLGSSKEAWACASPDVGRGISKLRETGMYISSLCCVMCVNIMAKSKSQSKFGTWQNQHQWSKELYYSHGSERKGVNIPEK